jgi:hypothetical protein
MPTDDVEGALAWIAAHKPNRNGTRPTIDVYPAKEVQGDSSEARFERLKASEKYLAGQIAGLQETAIPELVTKLASATGQEKARREKELFKANQHLLALRKEYRAIVKQITEVEFKRESLHRGMISVDLVRDALTECLMPAFLYCRNLIAGVADESEKTRLYAISAGFVSTFRTALKHILTKIGSTHVNQLED